MTLLHRLLSFMRLRSARLRHAEIAPSCRIEAHVSFQCGYNEGKRGGLLIDDGCELEQGVVLHAYGGKVRLGRNVFLGPYTVIYGHGGVEIGSNSLVSMHCRILSSNHTIPDSNILIRSQPDILLPTKIGRDVWLGAGVTVLGGVTIGDGCVVGAGAVVAHDLPPNSVAVGVPAKVIRQRVSQ